MLKAYIATVIGGWGRISGAILGALLIAIFETWVAVLVSTHVAEIARYFVLFAVLVFVPKGLLGEAEGRRV